MEKTYFTYYDFYQNKIANCHNKYLSDFWKMRRYELEHRHNYIQYMFPLDEPSETVLYSKILEMEDINHIKEDKEALKNIQNNLIKSLDVMLSFYGFVRKESKIITGKYFNIKRIFWMTYINHNFFRITRILKSLILFDLSDEAIKFYNILSQVYEKYPWNINEKSFKIWSKAVENYVSVG